MVEPITAATSRTARASGESRAARARTASPTVAGTVSPSAASTSVTKNGLPPVSRWRVGGVSAAALRQALHRRFRQRAEADAMDGWRRRQIAEDQAERVIGPDLVVTVGDDEEDREIANPPAEEAEQLERGTVGPVGIFGDDDRRPRPGGEGRQHLPEEPIPGVAVEGVLVDAQAERGRQVAHGTERTRCGERVARGPQHRRCRGDPAAERLDERGLADPGLTANEHQAPMSGGGLAQVLLELVQVLFALE